MMSEIEVGEYIRTKSGKIYKIDKIKKCGACRKPLYINIEKIKGLKFTNSYHANDIKAHSKNILDLVEVADYINGDLVYQITKTYISVGCITIGKRNAKNIKSILTHEQYEQYSYKVVE